MSASCLFCSFSCCCLFFVFVFVLVSTFFYLVSCFVFFVFFYLKKQQLFFRFVPIAFAFFCVMPDLFDLMCFPLPPLCDLQVVGGSKEVRRTLRIHAPVGLGYLIFFLVGSFPRRTLKPVAQGQRIESHAVLKCFRTVPMLWGTN